MNALSCLLRKVITHRETATSVALFRILLSFGLLLGLTLIAQAEALSAIWYPQQDGGIFPLTSRHWIFTILGGVNSGSVYALYSLAWVTGAMCLVGFGGRATILVCQQVVVALRTLNPNATGGYDSLIVMGLLLLLFTRPTETLSVDCLLLRGRWTSAKRISAWPRALIVFQVLFMYSMTGLQKIGYAWTPMGDYLALHYILNDPTWLRYDLATLPVATHRLLQLGTAVTWHWEQCSLLLLLHWYYRCTQAGPRWLSRWFCNFDLRKAWATIGVTMHAGILALLDVGPFSFVSLAYYACLWSPREWQALWRRCTNALVAARAPQDNLSRKSS